jgi:hypothetical protein
MEFAELLAIPLAIAENSGLVAGLEPPMLGCEWQPEHWLKLNRGPKPLLAPPETTSTSWNRARPFWKNSSAPVGLFAATEASGSGLVAVAPDWPLIGPERTPGSVCANALHGKNAAAPKPKNTAILIFLIRNPLLEDNLRERIPLFQKCSDADTTTAGTRTRITLDAEFPAGRQGFVLKKPVTLMPAPTSSRL